MNTTVKNWYIVAVMDGEQLVGEVLYGTVQEDQTFRFYGGDYVTTSRIVWRDLWTKIHFDFSVQCSIVP